MKPKSSKTAKRKPAGRTRALAVDAGSALYYVAQMLERLITNGEYRVKWEWAFSSLEELARDAARVEWKFGCADDGAPKDWQEWKDLRASVEKSGVGLRGQNRSG